MDDRRERAGALRVLLYPQAAIGAEPMNRGLFFLCMGALALGSACSRQDDSRAASQEAAPQRSDVTDRPMTHADHDMDDMGASDKRTAPAAADAAKVAQRLSGDGGFFEQAAEGGLAEVEAGKLAQSKGSRPEVKRFGAMMVRDHSKANAQLQQIAEGSGITLPTTLNSEHLAMRDKLASLSGEAFDREYIRAQIKDHETTVGLMKAEIDSGRNGGARTFAQKTLPTVQAHLEQIRQIAAEAGVTGEGG
jgi:putative membrane protein